MDNYTDEELREAGYFCEKCGLHPCSCEFLEFIHKYEELSIHDDLEKFREDFFNLKEENKQLKTALEWYKCDAKDRHLIPLEEKLEVARLLDKKRQEKQELIEWLEEQLGGIHQQDMITSARLGVYITILDKLEGKE